jgi:hypothetical protein
MSAETAAAAAAAIAQAIKASGAIVRVEPESFTSILSKTDKPLIVLAEGGIFHKNYQYLTAYKGLIFFTKSPTPLLLSSSCEIVLAKKIWVPN